METFCPAMCLQITLLRYYLCYFIIVVVVISIMAPPHVFNLQTHGGRIGGVALKWQMLFSLNIRVQFLWLLGKDYCSLSGFLRETG